MNRFEKIKVGDKAELKHLVTQKDIEKFVELTGDDNKLHVDETFSAQTPFKKPVVHGMLGASFISTIIGTKLPGDGALWYSQNLEFLIPIRVGDELTIKATVINMIEKSQSIELQTDIFNQNKQKVITGIAKVKVIKKNVADKQKKLNNSPPSKVALVIGATGGIGEQTCLQLAHEGFDIIIHYFNNQIAAERIKSKIEKNRKKVFIVKADITVEADVIKLAEFARRKVEHLTVIVNCATAKITSVKFDELGWDDIQKHINVNIKGNFYLLKHCQSLMLQNKYGKIILLTTQAIETPNADWIPYITAKSALHGFAKALAVNMAVKGIRINLISPGMTETTLISDIPEKTRLVIAAKTPLRRLARPEDIANAICFLASDKSDFMAGETLRINGGQVML